MIEFSNLASSLEGLQGEISSHYSAVRYIYSIDQLKMFDDLQRRSISSTIRVKNLYQEMRSMANSVSIPELCLIFVEMLANSSSRQATDPRDKVYGLLGLFPKPMVQYFLPSYTLDQEHVYIETAYSIL